MNRIEALRGYLEKVLGQDLNKVYEILSGNKDFFGAELEAERVLGEEKGKFIPLVLQLVASEDGYYS